MRLILVSVLSVVLAGLIGLWIVVARRAPVLDSDGPIAGNVPLDESDEPHPPVTRMPRPLRRLPTVPPPACIPRAGRACFRGRLILSPATQSAWAAARAEAGRASSADGDDDDDVGGDEDERETVDLDDVASSVDSTGVGGDAQADAPEPLPPEGSFARHFALHLEELSVASGGARDSDDDGESAAATVHSTTITIANDGTFEAQLAPGRYELTVASHDGFVVGGLDQLAVDAGEARDGVDVVLGPPLAIAGRVVDEDGVGLQTQVRVDRASGRGTRLVVADDRGNFRVGGLRPSAYRVMPLAAPYAAVAPVLVTPPLGGLTFRLVHLPIAMFVVARGADGRCPNGVLVARIGAVKTRVRFTECEGFLQTSGDGISVRMTGSLGGRPIDRIVSVGTAGAQPPICLDEPCRVDAAALDVRVVDVDGRDVSDAMVTASAASTGGDGGENNLMGWVASAPTRLNGLRAGMSIALQVQAPGVSSPLEASTTVYLGAGLGKAVLRLPGRASAGSS